MCGPCLCQVLQNILEAESEYSRELQSLLGSYLRSLHPTDRWSYFYTFYCFIQQSQNSERERHTQEHIYCKTNMNTGCYIQYHIFCHPILNTLHILQNSLYMNYYLCYILELGKYSDLFIQAFYWKCQRSILIGFQVWINILLMIYIKLWMTPLLCIADSAVLTSVTFRGIWRRSRPSSRCWFSPWRSTQSQCTNLHLSATDATET